MERFYTSPTGAIVRSAYPLDDVASSHGDLAAKGVKTNLSPLNELALRIFIRRHCRKKTVAKQ